MSNNFKESNQIIKDKIDESYNKLNQFKIKPNTPRDTNLKFNKSNILDNSNSKTP